MDCKVMTESRKMSPQSVDAVNDILSDEQQVAYKTNRDNKYGQNVSYLDNNCKKNHARRRYTESLKIIENLEKS